MIRSNQREEGDLNFALLKAACVELNHIIKMVEVVQIQIFSSFRVIDHFAPKPEKIPVLAHPK